MKTDLGTRFLGVPVEQQTRAPSGTDEALPDLPAVAAERDRLAIVVAVDESLGDLERPDALHEALSRAAERLGADAAALFGRLGEKIVPAGDDPALSDAAMRSAAREAGTRDLPPDGSHAIAVALRVPGDADAAIALWRSGETFGTAEIAELETLARRFEIGLANRALLDEVRRQLSGTLLAMIDLLERRFPDYVPRSSTVAGYAAALGRVIGMDDRELAELRHAAMLHDLGMLDIPEAILSAPRRLSHEEMAIVATHAKKGADLARLANFGRVVQQAILSHHERVDGTGYPRGLTGPAIPVEARIIAVCDAYVAMTSDRPHRPRMSPTDAVNQLRVGAGEHFDPGLVREFVAARSSVARDGGAPAS